MINRKYNLRIGSKKQVVDRLHNVSPRMDQINLAELLKEKPPIVEKVSEFEIYKLNETGKRTRRICGQTLLKKLPSFVPDGIPNPFNVINPKKEYICTNNAGHGRGTKWGPCKHHNYFGERGDTVTLLLSK